MMVDLNRLREAREVEYWDVEVLYALGDAAMDAPTVWWCMVHDMPETHPDPEGGHVACPHGSHSIYSGWDCDMRPGVWVPVKGGQE